MMRALLFAILACFPYFTMAQDQASLKIETLAQNSSSWDGEPYAQYPIGKPQITVLKITIAPNTTLKWHSHPMPNAGYLLSGELIVEKQDGTRHHFVAGDTIAETVGSIHRGKTGIHPAVLIVFYAGTPGLPLSH